MNESSAERSLTVIAKENVFAFAECAAKAVKKSGNALCPASLSERDVGHLSFLMRGESYGTVQKV